MKYVFLFTDPLAFLKTLLIFAAIFTAIALWQLLKGEEFEERAERL